MRTLSAVVTVALLGVARLAAGCSDLAGNLLAASNCGFDEAIAGWTALPEASVSRDPAEGGALAAVADPQGSLTLLGPCVAAKGATKYRIGARLRLASGTAYFCSVNVFQYSDDACQAGEEPLGSAAAPPQSGWTELAGEATTSAATRSVRLRPVCSGPPGFAVRFDDFALRP